MEDYGFACDCDRCKVEANWSDQEEEDNAIMEEEEEDMEEDTAAESDKEDNSEFPHAYFFVRYMCHQNNCGGTLAPLPPSSSQSQSSSSVQVVMECNVCGNLQTQQHPL